MKKLHIVIALMISCCVASSAQDFDLTLIPYRKGNLWGYSDTTGKIVIAPQFTEAHLFEGQLSMAKLDSYYCVIDRSGKIVYKSIHYTSVRDDGRTFLGASDTYAKQLFDAAGKPLTKVYNELGGFNKYGYADVVMNYTRHGLMDRAYKEVVMPQYGSIEFYGPALIKVYEDKKGYGLINLKTNKSVACKYGMIYPRREGLFMMLSDKLYGFMDETGREVIPAKYWKATPEGVELGTWYNESTYEDFNLDGFYEGVAVVVDPATKKAGYINKRGGVAIPFSFDKAYGFCRGRAWVKSSGGWGMINMQGRYVLQPVYKRPSLLYAKELEALDCYREGLIPVIKDSLYGYADTNGKVVIPFKFKNASPFHQGIAPAYKGGKMGFIDHSGAWVIQPVYEWAEGAGQFNIDPFGGGNATALKPDGGWVIIDKAGKQLVSIEFDKESHVSFEHGVGYGSANGKTYLFSEKGEILYTLPGERIVSVYSPHLIYNYGDKCYINIRTGKRFCE